MAKKAGRLARRYANALLTAAMREGITGSTELRGIAESFESFGRYFATNQELQDALLSPSFPREQREKALSAITDAINVPSVLKRGLQLLFQRDRLNHVAEIAEAFTEITNKQVGVVKVDVSTPQALSRDEQQRVITSLSPVIGGQPEFSWHVAPELIGGMVIKYGGKVIDGSVAGKLSRLEQQLAR